MPITLETNQQTIFSSVKNTAKDNYTRLIRTALNIIIKEKPFTFSWSDQTTTG